ncbi:hypothetical protein Vadar_002933 [Vaccinium darrowii]|uniref:Uncharacterized protein n=1 Tax=Vaccinium darrowii TaxID=229202 RepID=A0ACB7XWB8_9ERIC|nr:hypothetical protein Vadar_002933 [Vaccinium darrowii]
MTHPSVKRSTSMTLFSLEIPTVEEAAAPFQHQLNPFNTADHFLNSCILCNCRLNPCCDIYMYKGDRAFCSEECRTQQINQDKRNAKRSLTSKKEARRPAAAVTSEVVSNLGGMVVANFGGTVVAA